MIDELGEKFRQMDEGRAQALGKMIKMTPQVITALRTGMMDYGREFDQMLGNMTPAFDEAVKAAQRLHSAQSRLVRVMGLLWQGIASRFFAPFEKAFDTIRQAVIVNQAALIRFGAAVLQPLALALSTVAEAVSVVSNALSVLTAGFDALGPIAQTTVQTLLWGSAAYLLALKKITLAQIGAALTNPFVLIGAAIMAALILLDDFAVALKGGKTRWDWTPAIKYFKGLNEWGEKIETWIKSLPDKISSALRSIWTTLQSWWTAAINWMSAKWDAFIKTVTGWMPDNLKKQLGIKVEGDIKAPEVDRDTAIEQRRQVLLATKYAGDPTAYETATREATADVDREIAVRPQVNQQQTPAPVVIVDRNGAPIIKAEQMMPQSIGDAVPSMAKFTAALMDAVRGGVGAVSQAPGMISSAISSVAAAGETLRAQPLGSNVVNNVDASKKYDVNVPVSNTTTINITATSAEPATIGDQVERAVDTSNSQMIRNLQTPLAAIADDSDNTMGSE